ncbi:MAG: fibronectin type III domain-containing protein, partial [Halanaerobiales bacterium]
SGNWSASNLSGTLTITPALDDWVFTPESREVNSSSTEANFAAAEETPETYDISGRVTDFGRGLEGVSIQLSNGTEVITGPYGNWSVEGVSGRITVTPVKNDWEFEPESLTVNGPNDEVNFSVVDGENIVYTVSGYVTIGESEDGLQGVSIIMDDVSKTTTDENGYYSVEGLTGIETITPELEGWTFDPSSDAVAYYKNEINFTAEELVTFTASGQVTDSVTGEGLEGVNIQVGDNNVLTDTSGNWSVSGLNGNLMVTPSMEGWWFSPYSTNVYEENPTANFTGQTAADTPNAPTIIEGDGRLTVEWEPVLRGAYYYVYYATVDDSEEAVLAVGDITTTRYTITELENYTSYYIWVQASSLNSFFAPEGLSDLSPSVSGMPIEEDPANFAGGSGTVDDPYLIATPEQLDKVRDNLDKHFRQINDIDLSEYSNGEGWEPIGTWDSYSGPNFPFTGTYNGDNKTISGLTINRENSDHQALFAYTEGSSIENVILDNVSITTNETETAGLVGENKGDISNCTVSGTISGGSLTGGLIGKNDGNGVITSCSSVAIVSGGNEVGGLVGRNWSGNIETCQASGNITAEVAGGGLVGKNHSGGTIMNSEACGEVTTTEYGGCQGGGLVGSNGGRIENSFATGITNNGGRSGGLVGINEGSGIILASYSTGEVNGDWTGGLVGDNKGEVRECYSTGNVSGIGYRIGGLVGANSGEIYKSFARGNVTNGYYVGGLVGENTGRIENSYTTSEVYGTNMVGGLVGNNNSADSVIINCYATGPVSAIYDKTGGLIWQSHDNSTITNSYYDRELTGQNDTGKGEPRSTSEMTYPYEDVDTYLDWDFTGTWLEDSTGSNDGYPYLHWE